MFGPLFLGMILKSACNELNLVFLTTVATLKYCFYVFEPFEKFLCVYISAKGGGITTHKFHVSKFLGEGGSYIPGNGLSNSSLRHAWSGLLKSISIKS